MKVRDTVLLDQRKQTTAQLTAQEKHTLELDKRLAKAHIGYAQFDVVEHESKMEFKRWNKRDLKGSQVQGMLKSFLSSGVERFKSANAIPLCVSKKDVKMSSVTQDANMMDELPVFELTEAAMERAKGSGTSVMVCPTGQHRIGALKLYSIEISKELEKSSLARERLESRPLDATDSIDIEQENRVDKPK